MPSYGRYKNSQATKAKTKPTLKEATARLARLEALGRQQPRLLLRGYKDHPLELAKRLELNLWSKQTEIVQSVLENPRTLVQAGFSTGKTYVGAFLIFWWFATAPNSICLTSAPEFELLKDQLWAEVSEMVGRARRQGMLPADYRLVTLRLADSANAKHYAVGISPAKHGKTDELGAQLAHGFHGARLLVLLDEGQAIETARWSTFTAVGTGEEDRILAQGNPTVTSGPFYQAAKAGSGWNTIAISCFDHPNVADALEGRPISYPGGAVTLKWIEDRIWGPEAWCQPATESLALNFEWPPGSGRWWTPGPLFQARVLGEFPLGGTPDTLFPLALTESARQAQMEPEADDVIQLGLDVARYGGDANKLYVRQGPVVLEHDEWWGTDLVFTAGRAKDALERYPEASLVIDDVGVGGGVTDMLLAEGLNVIPFNGGEAPLDGEHYVNRRAESFCWLAERFQRGDIDLSRLDLDTYGALATQLAAIKIKRDLRQRRGVTSKDSLRAVLGRSPDDADALCMAFDEQETGVDIVGLAEEEEERGRAW